MLRILGAGNYTRTRYIRGFTHLMVSRTYLGSFFSASFKNRPLPQKVCTSSISFLTSQSRIFMTGKKNPAIVRGAYFFQSCRSFFLQDPGTIRFCVVGRGRIDQKITRSLLEPSTCPQHSPHRTKVSAALALIRPARGADFPLRASLLRFRR
jgi:hypothetical protein